MRRLLPLLLLALLWTVAVAQPPKPTFAVINPAVARLGQTADLGEPGTGIAFNEAKGVLVASREDGSLRMWTREEGKEWLSPGSKSKTLKAHAKAATGAAAGGAVVASCSTDGKVLVWNLPADKPSHTLNTGAAVRCVAVSPDGKVLACGGDDKSVQLWDPAAGKLLKKLTGPTDWVMAVALSADGKRVAAGGHDGRLWVWETADGKKVFDVPAHQPVAGKAPSMETNVVSALAFSPDGKQIALGGSDAKVYLFQAADGKYIRSLLGHTSAITGLAYHPGMATLVSSSKDRGLRLWNLQSGAVLKTLDGHTAWAEGVVFLDQGTRLASVGADRTVRLWELTPAAPGTKKKK